MLKNFKMLLATTTSMTIATPLFLISCSENVPSEVANISIDRTKMSENLVKNPDSTFTLESIQTFITSFNANPENYFISSSSTETPVGVVPFIDSDINKFEEKSLNQSETKLAFELELFSNPLLPTFETIKFSFNLKSKYTPEVVIAESPTDSLEALKTNIFSMEFRTLIPGENTEAENLEINWITKFVGKDFFKFIDSDIKKEFLAKTPAEAILLITNKIEFEKIFEMVVPFPSALVTGWSYEVVAITSSDPESITLKFTLSNPLLPTLTPEELTSSFDLPGFTRA